MTYCGGVGGGVVVLVTSEWYAVNSCKEIDVVDK